MKSELAMGHLFVGVFKWPDNPNNSDYPENVRVGLG